MSYCRGIIYVVKSADHEFDGRLVLTCFSPLHGLGRHYTALTEEAMVQHLEEHREDAEEILASIHKATERLKGEIAANR